MQAEEPHSATPKSNTATYRNRNTEGKAIVEPPLLPAPGI